MVDFGSHIFEMYTWYPFKNCMQVTHSSHPSLAESGPPRHSNTWGKFRKPNESLSYRKLAKFIWDLVEPSGMRNMFKAYSSHFLVFAFYYLHKQKRGSTHPTCCPKKFLHQNCSCLPAWSAREYLRSFNVWALTSSGSIQLHFNWQPSNSGIETASMEMFIMFMFKLVKRNKSTLDSYSATK